VNGPWPALEVGVVRLHDPTGSRGDSAPEVAKLMPELRRMFPDIPSSPELPSDLLL